MTVYTTEDFLAGLINFNPISTTNHSEQSFLAGLLKREESKPDTISSSEDNKTLKQIVVKLSEPVLIGKKGEKKYKLTLELFNEKVLLLKVIDISHGVGYIVVKRCFLERKNRSEITVSIK